MLSPVSLNPNKSQHDAKQKAGLLTLLEAQVGDFVDGRAVVLHEDVELIQEQLLLGVREPAALAAHLHAAHHVLLRGD